MYPTTQKFHRDLPPTPIFGYGISQATASFPGPTIEALRYVPTRITFENHLPLSHILPVDYTLNTAMPAPGTGVPGVVHLHGGKVKPDSDGSVFAWYTANYTRTGPGFTIKTYTYPNVQHSGNLMYHDHAMGLTRINLLAGLIGAYVIREPRIESLLNLPKGEHFDRHLIIADRSFYSNGSIYIDPVGDNPDIHPVWQPEYIGDAITVNGKIWPYLSVQRRKYRFRIMNAGNARYYNMTLSNRTFTLPFTVIGSDNSYLPAPVVTDTILVGIAETFDVVVDFTNVPVDSIELLNSAPYPFPIGPSTPGPSDSKIMKFHIIKSRVSDPSTVPPKLVRYLPLNPAEATVTRYIAFYEYKTNSTGQIIELLVNGKKLTDPVTETPKSGSTELWKVINLTADDHPLHIHIADFQEVKSQVIENLRDFTDCMMIHSDPLVCDICSHATGKVRPVVEYEKTWKNVVKIPPGYMTTVVVKFNMVDTGRPYPFDVTGAPGYVYHCHILDHEDNEMIRPLLLTH